MHRDFGRLGLPEGVQKIHFSSVLYNTQHRMPDLCFRDPDVPNLAPVLTLPRTWCRRCPISHSYCLVAYQKKLCLFFAF